MSYAHAIHVRTRTDIRTVYQVHVHTNTMRRTSFVHTVLVRRAARHNAHSTSIYVRSHDVHIILQVTVSLWIENKPHLILRILICLRVSLYALQFVSPILQWCSEVVWFNIPNHI